MPPRTVRTTQPYSFFALDPGQFEDLVYDLALRLPVAWVWLDPVGRAGSDQGRDIHGLERVPSRRKKPIERDWFFQAKRWERIGPAELRRVAQEAIPDPERSPYKLVVAVSARVSKLGFDAFRREALLRGATEADLWSRETLNGKLRLPANADLRAFYFGDGPAIEGTIRVPLGIDRNPGKDVPLVGREAERQALRDSTQDTILVGEPGSGKTRLAMEAPGIRFLNHEAASDAIADSLHRHRPRRVGIDDVGFDMARLRTLIELQRAGYRHAIVAVTWPGHLPDVRRLLPDAVRIDVPRLPRPTMDEIIQSLGVTNPFLRNEILNQAAGRPGWAVALAELAKGGQGLAVISGKALIDEVEPYLRRVGADSTEALGLLSVIASLEQVSPSEMTAIDRFLSISSLQRQKLIRQAAAAGVLDTPSVGGLRVAPEALRLALVAYWFYEQEHVPWPLDDVLKTWPDRRGAIIRAALDAAARGSQGARHHLEELVRDLAELSPDLVETYVSLDEHAARRALGEAAGGRMTDGMRFRIVAMAARRFVLPEAVRELLDLATSDDRPENQSSDHPIRLLGEIGTRITAISTSTFDAREPILRVSSEWFDDESSPVRALVFARLAAYLLSPTVSGNYTDPGQLNKIYIQDGFESPAHLEEIEKSFWPVIADRLPRLGVPALVGLVGLCEEWIRVARGFEAAGGVKPPPASQTIAERFATALVRALTKESLDKPGLEIRLRRTIGYLGVGLRSRLDPEFRVLTWSWDIVGRGKSRHILCAAHRLATRWAAEPPIALATRLVLLRQQAREAGVDLYPMMDTVMREFAKLAADIDSAIEAGMRAGLMYELVELMRASLARPGSKAAWLAPALASPARPAAVEAGLAIGTRAGAAAIVIAALDDRDVLHVEQAIIRRRNQQDNVSLALLRHPLGPVRGTASLWLGIDPSDHVPALPGGWYPDWRTAFEAAPVLSSRGADNHRLGEQLRHLVERDPDLVEQWLTTNLNQDFSQAILRIPRQAHARLVDLPRPNRDRLIRRFAPHVLSFLLLALLMGTDGEWIGELMDAGIVKPDQVLTALGNTETESDIRIATLVRLAPTLTSRGISPVTVAVQAMFGSWTGEESSHYEALSAAFAKVPPCADPDQEKMRREGIRIFAEKRDIAAAEEARKLIDGEL